MPDGCRTYSAAVWELSDACDMLFVRGFAVDAAVDCESAMFVDVSLESCATEYQSAWCLRKRRLRECSTITSWWLPRGDESECWCMIGQAVAKKSRRVNLALPTRKVVASRPTPDFTQIPLCAYSPSCCSVHINSAHLDWITMRFVLPQNGCRSRIQDQRCPSLPPVQPPNTTQFTIAIQHVVRQPRCRSQ